MASTLFGDRGQCVWSIGQRKHYSVRLIRRMTAFTGVFHSRLFDTWNTKESSRWAVLALEVWWLVCPCTPDFTEQERQSMLFKVNVLMRNTTRRERAFMHQWVHTLKVRSLLNLFEVGQQSIQTVVSSFLLSFFSFFFLSSSSSSFSSSSV